MSHFFYETLDLGPIKFWKAKYKVNTFYINSIKPVFLTGPIFTEAQLRLANHPQLLDLREGRDGQSHSCNQREVFHCGVSLTSHQKSD